MSKIKLSSSSEQFLVGIESIQEKIFFIRGKKVMIDRDLANLYGVATKVLNQAVRRNIERFPEDFMFQLSWKESESSRSQIVTLNKKRNNQKGTNIKYLSYAFTEQGVAMLSSVLNSKRAIQVNIQIMRTFTRIREMMLAHKDLRAQLSKIEKNFEEKFAKHDQQFKLVFEAIRQLIEPPYRKKLQ